MHFVCARSTLANALKIAGRAVRSHSPIPVTEMIRFRAEIKGEETPVALYSTDTEIAIHNCFLAYVFETGEVCIPAKRITEIVNSLPATCLISLTCSDQFGITVSAGKATGGTFRMMGMPAKEMPAFPPVKDETGFLIPESLWHAMLTHVVYATSKDNTRPRLTGSCLTIEGSNVELAATDAHTLAVFRQTFDGDLGRDLKVIIPREIQLEMLRLLDPESDAQVSLWIDENQIAVGIHHNWFFSRLISADYPNYQCFLPESVETRITLPREPLIESFKRMLIVARDFIFRVDCAFSENRLRMKACVGDQEAEEEVEAVITGHPQTVSLHAGQMVTLLESFNSESVAIGLNGPSRPVLIEPVDSLHDYLAVNVPMTPE